MRSRSWKTQGFSNNSRYLKAQPRVRKNSWTAVEIFSTRMLRQREVGFVDDFVELHGVEALPALLD